MSQEHPLTTTLNQIQAQEQWTPSQRLAMLELVAWIMLVDKKVDPAEMALLQGHFPDLPLMAAIDSLCHMEDGGEAAHLAYLRGRLVDDETRAVALSLCHAMAHADEEFHPQEVALLVKIEASLTA